MENQQHYLTSTYNKKDQGKDEQLRPADFDSFPGQVKVKERLQIYVEAAKQREEPLGHLLLSGPPGLGKTTLAYIIANEKGASIKTSSGPIIEKPGDLAGVLTSLEKGDILFIDEIHRLNNAVEEYLYSAMEDFFIDIMIDQGAGGRNIRLNIQPFTLIGATTRQGLLTAPLRSRFTLTCRLDYYPSNYLQKIIVRSAKILNIEIDQDGALQIAQRSRGTPRIANNLLRWTRDFAQVRHDNKITGPIAEEALHMAGIDEHGLDDIDKEILKAILHKFDGGPVGVKSLAVAAQEEVGTIEEVYEPFLIQEGYMMRTSQGRVATNKARALLGLPKNEDLDRNASNDGPKQPDLF